MDKIIVMVRTSTERQSTEAQHAEMEEFCIAEGWPKDSIIWIEEEGASAAKVDDIYRAMIDKVKSAVEKDPDIKCFAVWHLNRLARTEDVWIEVKQFFVSRHVQIICKNPYLKLLTPDGNLDPGMELAMGLLAILSKQENEERKAKFRRAKHAMREKGQFVGGNTRKYGYKVENKFFVEDEEEGAVVRTIFELYSTGNYSSYTLTKELNERGIDIGDSSVMKILQCAHYCGEEDHGRRYPPIISKELFDKCAEIRKGNLIVMKRGQKLVLGAKLMRCSTCGAICTSNSRHYVCCRSAHHGRCGNHLTYNQDAVHDILWRVAQQVHMDYLMDLNQGQIEEYKKTLEVLEKKISATKEKISQCKGKKERIVESYMDGLIDKEKRDLRLSKIEDDVRVHQESINALVERCDAIARLISTTKTDIDESFAYALDELDLSGKYEVIHQHINKVVGTAISYGKRDPRTHKPNGIEFVVTSKAGKQWKFMYFPKRYEKHNLYVWNGKKWVADEVTPV